MFLANFSLIVAFLEALFSRCCCIVTKRTISHRSGQSVSLYVARESMVHSVWLRMTAFDILYVRACWWNGVWENDATCCKDHMLYYPWDPEAGESTLVSVYHPKIPFIWRLRRMAWCSPNSRLFIAAALQCCDPGNRREKALLKTVSSSCLSRLCSSAFRW